MTTDRKDMTDEELTAFAVEAARDFIAAKVAKDAADAAYEAAQRLFHQALQHPLSWDEETYYTLPLPAVVDGMLIELRRGLTSTYDIRRCSTIDGNRMTLRTEHGREREYPSALNPASPDDNPELPERLRDPLKLLDEHLAAERRLRNAIEALFEFWDKGTPVHARSLVVGDLRAAFARATKGRAESQ